MCSGSGPAPLDYKKLAEMQDKSNLQTAINNSRIGNVNTVTPWGSTTFTSTLDKNGVPQYTANQNLSPAQQELLNRNNATALTTANIANRETGDMSRVLNREITAPNYTSYGGGPNLQNHVGFAGEIDKSVGQGTIKSNIAGAGPIRQTVANAGEISREIGDAGAIQKNLGDDDFSGARQRVEDALFTRLGESRTEDWDKRRTELANQGIREGSDAYTRAERDFTRGTADQRTNAILAAGTEQNRMQDLALGAGTFANNAQAQLFGQLAANENFKNQAQAQQYGQNANDLAAWNAGQAQRYGQNANNAQFWNTAQNQNFTQDMANAQLNNAGQAQLFGQMAANANLNNQALQGEFNNRNTVTAGNNDLASRGFADANSVRDRVINETAALRNGTQVTPPPTFSGSGTQMAGTDIAGLATNQWNQQNAQFLNQQQQNNSLWGGILGAGANLLTLSDERAKTEIERIGETDDGIPIKSFRYRGEGQPKQIGFIAQDVRRKRPDAVGEIKTPDGRTLLGVNYRAVTERRAA